MYQPILEKMRGIIDWDDKNSEIDLCCLLNKSRNHEIQKSTHFTNKKLFKIKTHYNNKS